MKRAEFECALRTCPLHGLMRRFVSKSCRVARNPPVERGDGGFVDWVIVGLHCLRGYPGHPDRTLRDVLHEMHEIIGKFGLAQSTLPDFTTVCARKQESR